MDNELSTDLNTILESISALKGSSGHEIQEFLVELESKHALDDMTEVYNHILKNEHDPVILLAIVKRINTYKPAECLDTLLDIILLKEHIKEKYNELDEYIDLRVNVAKVISNYKDNRAVLPLLYCMNNKDEHYKIRLASAEALGKIGDKYAVTPLIDLVSDENEKSVYVRESAATALGMIGDMRAVDSLVHILEAKKSFLDKFTFLKERVIEALGKINSSSDKVFKALKNSLDDESPQIRINAIEALMNLEDDRAIEAIKTTLNDPNEEVIQNAVIALYNLEGADLLNELIEDKQYNAKVREYAQDLLAEYENDDDDDYGDEDE